LKQEAALVSLTGVAQSNERVAEFLRNLSGDNPYITKPELVEIVAGTTALTPKDQRRVSNFVIRVQLKKIAEDKKPVTPAAGSVTPSSAAAVLVKS
jgi:type IV pilus assembly protein PilN